MNIENASRWMIAPKCEQNAIGAALRRVCSGRLDCVPEDLRGLLERIQAPRHVPKIGAVTRRGRVTPFVASEG